MNPAPLTPQPEWHYLPRLAPEFYRGFAVVHWTITLVWMGLQASSDQRNAMKFLRKHLAAELALRSPKSGEFELQKQPHDSVLREKERVRGAFAKACFYILDNPRQAGLVDHSRNWPHLGTVVPGYPFLHPLAEDFWELFWKFYEQHREPTPTNP